MTTAPGSFELTTSIHGGIVTLDTTLYGGESDPCDVVTLRDGVANGLLHLADFSLLQPSDLQRELLQRGACARQH